MSQIQLATRIDAEVKKAVETLCESRGLKMNRFIEDALIDKLEELEDTEDLARIRFEPTRPLSLDPKNPTSPVVVPFQVVRSRANGHFGGNGDA